jgi:hypothetical protein
MDTERTKMKFNFLFLIQADLKTNPYLRGKKAKKDRALVKK